MDVETVPAEEEQAAAEAAAAAVIPNIFLPSFSVLSFCWIRMKLGTHVYWVNISTHFFYFFEIRKIFRENVIFPIFGLRIIGVRWAHTLLPFSMLSFC